MTKQSSVKLIRMLNILLGITIILVLTFLPSSEILAGQDVEPLPNAEIFASVKIATDESIRKRIVRETTGLAEALAAKQDLTIIRLLRGWAADNMDVNGGGTSYWLKLEKSNRTLGNMLYLFDHNLLGVNCGDGSRFLQKIYALYGYESLLYNSGVNFQDPTFLHLNEGYTHVITLVKITHQGEKFWVAEDALFDAEYRLSGKEVSDFSEIIAQISSNPHKRVDRLYDQVVFNRERLSISEKAAQSAQEFEDFAREIHVHRGPDTFKPGWDTWIKQESAAARVLRDLLDFEGRIYPYHLFRFPIGQGQRIPGVDNLRSVEDLYRSKLNARTETIVTLGK